MKRESLALLAFLLMAADAAAQQPPPPPRLQRSPAPPQPPPPPPAALSVPNPLAAFRPGPRDLYRSPDGSDRFKHGSQYPVPPPIPAPPIYFPGGYFFTHPYYVDPYDYDSARWYWKHALRRHEIDLRGGLVLGTLPDEAEVYVDGYYAGLAQEFGWSGRPMDVAAGAHRIEARAAGYEPLSFSVMIEPGQILRYRGGMTRVASPTPVVVVVAPQQAVVQSIYVIPNCYAGNRPPGRTLPKGCERKNLQTRR